MTLKNLFNALVNPLCLLTLNLKDMNSHPQKFKRTSRARGSGADFLHLPAPSYQGVSYNKFTHVTKEILMKITYSLLQAKLWRL